MMLSELHQLNDGFVNNGHFLTKTGKGPNENTRTVPSGRIFAGKASWRRSESVMKGLCQRFTMSSTLRDLISRSIA